MGEGEGEGEGQLFYTWLLYSFFSATVFLRQWMWKIFKKFLCRKLNALFLSITVI